MSDTPPFAQDLHDFFGDLVPFLQNLSDPGFLMTTDLPQDPTPFLNQASDLAAYVAAMPGLKAVDEKKRYSITPLGKISDEGPQDDEWQVEVPSESSKAVYMVRYDRISHVVDLKENGIADTPDYACTCRDYLIRRKPDGKHCKHITSVINEGRGFGQRPGPASGQRPPDAEPVPTSVYDHALGAL